MANSDVFIDDIRLQDLGITVRLNSQEPMLPDLRPNTIAIPGRHGAYDFGAFFDAREFLLDCVFKRQDYADLKVQIRQFVRLFVDDYGRPKSVKLRFGDEPDKYYDVKLRVGVPVERLAGFGTFTLPLIAHDPMAKASSDAYDEVLTYNSGFEYDKLLIYANTQEFKWLYNKHYSSLYNHSNIRSDLCLLITGACKNIKVTNTSTGISCQISGIFGSNDKILIDSKNFTVSKNDSANLLTNFTGDFIQLIPGTNHFTFESETVPNSTVSYEWNHLFV